MSQIMINDSKTKSVIVFLLLLFVCGCATNQTTPNTTKADDPIESANRVSYTFTDTLDRNLLKPVAETYAEYTPAFARDSITNFFDNLSYLNVVLNSFLQGKFNQGMQDTSRFIANSTFGVMGLFDVATPIGLPAHQEDLGQTLAVWGVNEGSYLYVPIGGPNTTRNLPNYATSYFLNPLTYVTGAVLFPLTALDIINKRANLLEATNIRDEAAVDPYIFTREAYLQQREYLIFDGHPPVEGYDDIFDTDTNGKGSESGVLKIE